MNTEDGVVRRPERAPQIASLSSEATLIDSNKYVPKAYSVLR